MAAPQQPPRSGPGKGLERALSLGADLVRQAREAQRQPARNTRERELEAAHRNALIQHESAVRRYRAKLAAGKIAAVSWFSTSGILGLSALGGVNDVQSTVILGGLTAGAAAMGTRSVLRRKQLKAHPPVPALPPLPPARLPRGTRGAPEADHVADTLMHLYDLVPNVARLHPDAGQEMWRAVSDVEPLLRGQVERLDSLNRLHYEMPGSRAAAAAEEAGIVVAARLGQGAAALEALLAAAAGMLAAPDLSDVDQILSPAITSLTAFRHGLETASELGGIHSGAPGAGWPGPAAG